MQFLDIPQKKTLSDIGLDQFGQAPIQFFGSEVNLKAQTMFEGGVPSNFVQDGDTIVGLTVVDGYLQSSNYVVGVSGWRLSPKTGDISGVTGTFVNAVYVGNNNVILDGVNKRIIVNDGTNDRVLIGYLAGKF